MTDDQINVAIAECCGWKSEQQDMDWWPITRWKNPDGLFSSLPSYCTDLNAMHEAEATQSEKEWIEYMRWFSCKYDSQADEFLFFKTAIHATAHQRAEAFLRVKGLWKE